MVISRSKINFRENCRVIAEHVTDYTFAPHMHNECEYICMLAGECTLRINFGTVKLAPGEAFFFMPWQLHSVEGCPGSEMYIITFSNTAVGFFDDIADTDCSTAKPYIPSADINAIVENELIKNDCADVAALCACANLLVADFFRHNPQLNKGADPASAGHIVHAAAKFVREHYREELTLMQVAEAVGTSASYLSRVMNLKNELGFSKYLNELRISHAQMLLRTTDMRIADIARDSGYTNIRTFNRIFKEHFHCSPSDMRNDEKT